MQLRVQAGGGVMRICKHCPRTTQVQDAVARAQGWRWYDGPTLGGGHLSDVVCPYCAGTATEPDPAEEWHVGCRTCDWDSAEDGDRIINGKDAVSAARFHECEPEVWIRPPGADRDYTDWDFDRDGNLLRVAVAA
jgi:hypothetical protein